MELESFYQYLKQQLRDLKKTILDLNKIGEINSLKSLWNMIKNKYKENNESNINFRLMWRLINLKNKNNLKK